MAAAGVWKIVPDDGQDGGDVMFGLYLPKSWESIIKIKFEILILIPTNNNNVS